MALNREERAARWRWSSRQECALPLTSKACVDRVITDLAGIDVTPEGFVLREFAHR
jgi:acyl CoA:acetate/3-ketoacid CoA transferase beta subunit